MVNGVASHRKIPAAQRIRLGVFAFRREKREQEK
jgi:hypothetical protein